LGVDALMITHYSYFIRPAAATLLEPQAITNDHDKVHGNNA
jgi:hypothetical protein